MGSRFTGSDASAIFVEADTNAADVASIAANQRPTSAFTINGTDADGGAVVFASARKVSVTTTSTNDAGKKATITGTDINGAAQSEELTMLGSAATVVGSLYFKTISGAVVSAQPAQNVSLGMSDAVAVNIYGGRARLQGTFIVCSTSAGILNFVTTGVTGASQLKLGTVASATVSRDVTIPDEGILFTDGIFLLYDVADFANMTVFHA
jgi:hypothetical protein|tara:strand:+ start:6555 stop:7181 length:627 start_codon:yes stop_codon:yes gene_type:complete